MPLWLTILCSTGIAGLIVKEFFCWIKASTKKAKAETKRKKQAEMREVMQEELKPFEQRMVNIEKNTEDSVAADVLALRCNMKNLRDRVKKQGFADIGDKATFTEIYNKYKAMGGNHFVEYVDKWKEEVEALPTEKPKRAK